MRLDLTQGICKNEQYDAWKFPGGEIHFKLKSLEVENNINLDINIVTRLNTSDDIIFLLIVVDTLKKDIKGSNITLFLPYMPYQQADRDFGIGECFSLKTICNLINSLQLSEVTLFAPHSDVSAGLLNNCKVICNHAFISTVLGELDFLNKHDDLVVISPDSGAYKLIFKLCEKLNFKGQIITCSKSRNHETGVITTVVPKFDDKKTVLIIDDICLAGNTFFNIRKEIPNENVFLAVSHGIFNDNVDKLETQFTKVYTTNSRRDDSIGKNIKVIKVF